MADRFVAANEALQKAKKLGMELIFDSGLIVMRETAPLDSGGREGIVKRLLLYSPEILLILLNRTRVERAKQLFGAQLFIDEYPEPGELVGASDNKLIAEVNLGFSPNSSQVTVDAARMIVNISNQRMAGTGPEFASHETDPDTEREKLGHKGLARLLGFAGKEK